MGYKKKTYETIDNIVKGVCMDLDEGLERYEQYLHWALKAHKDWHIDQSKEVKTIFIDLTSYKAAPLPDDYVDWTKIGLKCGNTFLTFTQDNYMAFPVDSDEDCEPDADEDCPSLNVEDFSIMDSGEQQSFAFYYYNLLNDKGQDTGKLFGLSAKDNYQGYFRLNEEREELQFRSKILNLETIALEYISNGYAPCADSFVHPYAAELITLFVHWHRTKHNKHSLRWQVEGAKENYWQEFDRVQYRIFDLSTEDILEAWREGYTLLPMN